MIQLNGVNIGNILGMVLTMTDITKFVFDESEALSTGLVLSIFLLLVALFVAFLVLSFMSYTLLVCYC